MRLEIGTLRRNVIALGFLLLVYVLFGAVATLQQERLIYRPSADIFEECEAFPLGEKRALGNTRAYIGGEVSQVMVIYHGNVGSACDRDYLVQLAEVNGYAYVLVEYTGYAGDTRAPSHEAVKENVRDVVEYLRDKSYEEVVVLGESISTGAASYHASLLPPDKLILISPFRNLLDIAKNRFWFYPTSLLVNNAFDNEQALAKYRGDVLIFHGDRDWIIPIRSAELLFEAPRTDSKEMVIVYGAGHNSMFEFVDIYMKIYEFLSS